MRGRARAKEIRVEVQGVTLRIGPEDVEHLLRGYLRKGLWLPKELAYCVECAVVEVLANLTGTYIGTGIPALEAKRLARSALARMRRRGEVRERRPDGRYGKLLGLVLA